MSHSIEISLEFKDLLTHGKEYELQKGQVIQSTEDRRLFNLVHSGYIKRYLIGSDGSLGVQVLYGPGDIFPITLAFNILLGMEISESKEVYYYEAMTDVTLYSITEDELQQGVESNNLFYKDLMTVAGRRLHSTLNGLENLTLRSSYERVAHQLAYLAHQFGVEKKRSVKILIPITNKDLSEILSMSRETVSVSITKLRKKGLVKSSGSLFVVPDVDKLLEEAFS